MADEPKQESKMPFLRTIGGLIVSMCCAAAGFLLVWRNAPVASWATAFALAMVAATIIEPTMLADWILRRNGKK